MLHSFIAVWLWASFMSQSSTFQIKKLQKKIWFDHKRCLKKTFVIYF